MNAKTVIIGALTVAAVVVFVNLGFWQLDRLKWKTDLIQKIEAEQAVDASTVPLGKLIDNPNNNLRRGYLSGIWIDTASVRVGPKAIGDQWGYWIITPLALGDGTTILVNRGWVDDKRAMMIANGSPQKDVVKVMGTLRAGEKGAQVGTDTRLFHVLDVENIAKAMGQNRVARLALFMDSSNPADDAAFQPAPVTASMRNAHLQYAIFWFGAAGLLSVLTLIFILRGKR